MFGKSRLSCSFCGKSAAEVSKLVAGPHVYICDECVAIANRIMSDSETPPAPQPTKPSFWRRMVDAIRRPLSAQAATI